MHFDLPKPLTKYVTSARSSCATSYTSTICSGHMQPNVVVIGVANKRKIDFAINYKSLHWELGDTRLIHCKGHSPLFNVPIR